jgi:hypothetical protein
VAKPVAKSKAAPREQAVEKDQKADYGRASEVSKKKAPEEVTLRSLIADDDVARAVGRADDLFGKSTDAAAATSGGFSEADIDGEAETGYRGGATPAPMPSLGTLAGRILLHRDGRLVIEVEVTSPLSWRPPTSLLAFTAHGEAILVPLPTAGTTAAAELQPGMRLRVVLELPDGMPVPARLELEIDGRLLTITLIG